MASYEILGLLVTKVSATLLENFADDAIAYYVALCDKLFDNFPLFDETFLHKRHKSNTVKSAKTFLTVQLLKKDQIWSNFPGTGRVRTGK